MAKVKESRLKSGRKLNVRLRDLDKDTLVRKVKEVEDHDKVQYRRTCCQFQPTTRKPKPREEYDGSSSDESVEYYKIEPYKLGALGLVPSREIKRKALRRAPSVKKVVPKERSFDWVSASILSDLGLLNKFERKGRNNFVKMESTVRKNRTYYYA